MKIVTDLPRRVREIENLFIELADGCRLAARVWLPQDAEADPVPAILECLPYRKRDGTSQRDALTHPWFAGHGYAAIRLDIRGSGDSEGLPLDEYVKQEQDDMLAALAWIAAQPWCSGACGMIGISWGGFSGLQVAMRRPPQLKAVITLCSTDDRYADDVHYMAGCLLRNNLAWGAQSLAYSMRPPDPEVVGDAWRDMWLERLRNLPFTTAEWMSHQRRDAYWKHGSVNEDWDAIQCPVYAVTGWADGYTNTALRLMEGLRVPRRCLIGPWAHGYPHIAAPGPPIGFLQDCLRWWDRWLKGIENGIDDEPMVRLWLQDAAPPRVEYAERPGRWIAEPSWPAPSTTPWPLALDAAGRLAGSAAEAEVAVATPLAVGTLTGEWNPHGIGPELAADQRPEDAVSVLFDSAPLERDVAIVGFPLLRLRVAADKPVATVVARLEYVTPDGASALLSWGCLNLTHRESHESPSPLEPGRRYDVTVRLNAAGQRVAAGSRLRLALATASWPLLWPAPEAACLTVACGASRLELPLREAQPLDDALAPFEPAEMPQPPAIPWQRPFGRVRRIERELGSGLARLVLEKDDGAFTIESHGMTIDQKGREVQEIVEGDPLSSRGEVSWSIAQSRGAWRVRIEATTTVTCDAESFRVNAEVAAWESDGQVFRDRLTRRIPRDLM